MRIIAHQQTKISNHHQSRDMVAVAGFFNLVEDMIDTIHLERTTFWSSKSVREGFGMIQSILCIDTLLIPLKSVIHILPPPQNLTDKAFFVVDLRIDFSHGVDDLVGREESGIDCGTQA